MKKNKVLFVDDEIQVLNSIKRSTLEEEYESFIATSGEKALELMEKNEFCVVVSDMRMPGMDGLTLLKVIKEKYPDTIRMVLSGYNQVTQILTTINQVGVTKFIVKPWLVEEEFLPAIRECVEYYTLKKEGEELKRALVAKNNSYQKILKVNNDIMNNIQEDKNKVSTLYDNIQSINKVLLSKINVGNGVVSQVKSFNEIAKRIFNGYLITQPSKIEEFKLSKLVNQTVIRLDKKIEFSNIEKDLLLKGNFRLILLILSELLTELIKGRGDNILFVDIDSTEIGKVIFTISKSKNNSIDKDSNNLNLMSYLLNSFNNLSRGKIELGKDNIRIQFVFENS